MNLENFQLGRTKIFLRAGQIAVLDSKRIEVLDNAARLIQGHFRTFTTRKEFVITKTAAIALQSCCRGNLARNIFSNKRRVAAALIIQQYVRRWLTRHAYLHIYSAVLIIQSCVRGFFVRQRFMCIKDHRAAMFIQVYWRMWKTRMAFQHCRHAAVSIQCAWRRKSARKELHRLRLAANEAGALREAKNKLEKKLEDLTWRLTLEKRLRANSEESKSVEVSKFHNALEAMHTELAAAKLSTVNERIKNTSLQEQLDERVQDNVSLESTVAELNRQNLYLKDLAESLAKKNSELEKNLLSTKKHMHDTLKKLQDVEAKYMQLQQNLHSLEEKVSNLEDENLILRQKAISTSPLNKRAVTSKSFPEKYAGSIGVPIISQKPIFETPTPTKFLVTTPHSLSETRKTRMTAERQEENHGFLLTCITEDLGFKDDKPVAACVIYKFLLHRHAFEAERTAIFDYIIEAINDVLKVDNENDILPYWLSNASALLCLLQRNLRLNGFITTPSRRSAGSLGLSGRMAQALKSPLKLIGAEENGSKVDARYPAILFKQQLTACLEKIYGLIRDNLKKELSPLLSLCIQAPKSTRAPIGKTSKSPGGIVQPHTHWDGIIKFLDALMIQLRQNYVPSIFIRKLVTQVFAFINNQLFNSLLLRRECCTFSNGEYVKSGLAVLEKWIADAKEEFAGTTWHELNYIRQAVGFLVIHQKRRKTLEEIKNDLCPALSVQQIYRICTMYWDDKYSTESVSKEVVAEMREMINKGSQNLMSNSFLLDDDLSIPFLTEDISKAIPPIDPTVVELPPSLQRFPSAQFLIQHAEASPA